MEFCAERKTPEVIAAKRQLLNPLRNASDPQHSVDIRSGALANVCVKPDLQLNGNNFQFQGKRAQLLKYFS
jgi:hypothetical protein